MNEDFLNDDDGRYFGENDLIKTRKADKCKFAAQGRKRRASRWMLLKVNDELRSKKFDDEIAFHENHGYSTLKIGPEEVTPKESLQLEFTVEDRTQQW